MNQTSSSERLSAYIDGELDADEATLLERELADDPTLRAEYDSLKGAVDFVRAYGPLDAPADFHARVMARASVLESPPLGLWERLANFLRGVPLEGVAVALAAAMIVVILVDQPKTSAPPAPPPEAPPVATGPVEAPPIAPTEAAPVVTPSTTTVVADASRPTPVPISEERNDVLDEILGAPAAERDQDGVALAPASGLEAGAPNPAVERQVSEAMRAAVTLRVKTDDPLVLQQLDRLAQSYGGVASGADGGALSAQRLGQAGRVDVRVRLPAEQLTGFQMKARGLGQVELLAQQNTNLYGSAPIEVLVEVDYRP